MLTLAVKEVAVAFDFQWITGMMVGVAVEDIMIAEDPDKPEGLRDGKAFSIHLFICSLVFIY